MEKNGVSIKDRDAISHSDTYRPRQRNYGCLKPPMARRARSGYCNRLPSMCKLPDARLLPKPEILLQIQGYPCKHSFYHQQNQQDHHFCRHAFFLLFFVHILFSPVFICTSYIFHSMKNGHQNCIILSSPAPIYICGSAPSPTEFSPLHRGRCRHRLQGATSAAQTPRQARAESR